MKTKSPFSILHSPSSILHSPFSILLLFFLAFLPRAIYPVSRPLQWYFRSAEFFQAVMQGDWAGTLLSEHPGVTVMWLSGGTLWGWYGLQSLLGLNPPTPLETVGYAFADRVAVGVIPLALIVALGIVWGWCLLRRLFGERVAWVAALLWALDPFYLANSKVLHLDATLSTLMILSALWMLIYLREGRPRQIVISAVLGGLAILTKVTAIFLIPFWGLCLLVQVVSGKWQVASGKWRVAISNFLLWLLAAAMICFVLWPSLWVQPGASFDLVVRQGILLHTGGPRDQPLFYRGVLGVQDPGPRFYLDTILYRSTFLTLPLALVGLASTVSAVKSRLESRLLLFGFVIFYFIQMTLGGWKDSRYMLPIMLLLDLFAAFGLVWWIERNLSGRRALALLGILLTGQALIVLPHHPYYGTHYNELLGGPRAAQRIFPLAEFGEGLDLAGQYVDSRPDASDVEVGTQFLANEMVAQHVSAPVRDIAQAKDDVDYLIFGVQYTTRGESYPRWGELWEQSYKFHEPEFVVAFDGIPYAWVHRPGAAPIIPQQANARLGRAIKLEGYRLVSEAGGHWTGGHGDPPLHVDEAGDTLLLTLYWRAESPVAENYTVFTHLQNAEGELVAQQDNVPVRGARPTSGWQPGELIEDPYELHIPTEASYGDYTLSVGMYDPATVERLPPYDASGETFPNHRIVLQTVFVRPVVPIWRRVLAGAWLAIIVLGAVWPQSPNSKI